MSEENKKMVGVVFALKTSELTLLQKLIPVIEKSQCKDFIDYPFLLVEVHAIKSPARVIREVLKKEDLLKNKKKDILITLPLFDSNNFKIPKTCYMCNNPNIMNICEDCYESNIDGFGKENYDDALSKVEKMLIDVRKSFDVEGLYDIDEAILAGKRSATDEIAGRVYQFRR